GLWGRFLDRFLTAKVPQPFGAGRAQKKSAGGPLVAQAFRPASRPPGSSEGLRYQRFLRRPKRALTPGSDLFYCSRTYSRCSTARAADQSDRPVITASPARLVDTAGTSRNTCMIIATAESWGISCETSAWR